MTIKNMTYIHNLLIENEKVHKNSLELIRKCKNQAEDENAENLPTLKKSYDKAWNAWRESINALHEFEKKEWN